jgi:hypothetical protein
MNKNCAVGVPIATGVGKKYPPLPRTLGCQKWNLFSKSVLVYRGWRLGSPIKGRVKKKNTPPQEKTCRFFFDTSNGVKP